MPHTYTQNSVTRIGDAVTVVGAVDEVPVTVTFSASVVAGLDPDAMIEFVAALMLAAVPQPPEDLTSQYPATVTL